MQYDDSIDRSRQYLRHALQFIGKHRLPMDPLNYCVWYEYASGKNGSLNAAINRYLEGNRAFSRGVSKQLFNEYIIDGKEKVTALIREALRKILAEAVGAIKETDQHFSESENHLEDIHGAIVPKLSEADMEKIVSQIRDEVRSLESSSSTFREQLRQATREINRLKIKMARYRNEALKDAPTRVDNRRVFEERLAKAIDLSNSEDAMLSLIITDIDHFKHINDTHGHLVGDNVLRMVARHDQGIDQG
jgi:diguanylate cyclase